MSRARRQWGRLLGPFDSVQDAVAARDSGHVKHQTNMSGLWVSAPGGNSRRRISRCADPAHGPRCPVTIAICSPRANDIGWYIEVSLEADHTERGEGRDEPRAAGAQQVPAAGKKPQRKHMSKAQKRYAEELLSALPYMTGRDLWRAFQNKAKLAGAAYVRGAPRRDGRAPTGGYEGTPVLRQCQQFKKLHRAKDKGNAQITTVHDLRMWASQNHLPQIATSCDDLEHGKTYVVPLQWHLYPSTEGVVLVSKSGLEWLQQIVESGLNYAMHVDGKHKIHYGKWILVTMGVHSLENMFHCRTKCCHSFRPVIHFFGKQHESEESMVMLLDGVSFCVQKLFGYPFSGEATPALGIWDRAAGFLAGWSCKFNHAEPDFATCWPHIIRKVREGEYLNRSHPLFEEFVMQIRVRACACVCSA